MAGFFLGGGSGAGGSHQPPRSGVPPTEGGFFLYEPRGGGGGRGEDASAGYATRGFELWQQHGQIYPGGGGVFPDEAQPRGGVSCRDCGNQAKKDCVHLRCRTCCQSRGFACSTHVKSTWVPAARRRERQQNLAGAAQLDHHRHRASSSSDAAANAVTEPSNSKRQRELTAGSARPTTAIAVPSMFGELQESFPAEVSAPASFRCVRVSHVDEGDEVYAYQTAINIGGHVFKGLLYDHGPEAGPSETYPPGGASTSSSRHPHLRHPGDTGSSSPTATAALGDAAINATGVDQLFDPYPTPLSAFMAGTQFFPHQHRP
ncbi:protein SHI RELATED SEQUENCE 1-like [Zingiber officinale]|uniref:protein SHI RELATED SEQUENCE 1-like n=1 Tax=Zingiber officinale TaxID=94328 RepID=UPI001C4BAE7C|nr:protein SHI RELATED SEQUENCE 1-like [Zingiber officinale]